MQKDWHTIGTAIGKIVPQLFGSRRPKIWLRRCKDRTTKLAIEEYDLNRDTQAEAGALKNLRERM